MKGIGTFDGTVDWIRGRLHFPDVTAKYRSQIKLKKLKTSNDEKHKDSTKYDNTVKETHVQQNQFKRTVTLQLRSKVLSQRHHYY